MDKVNYSIHHQAVAFCPKCQEMFITDLGESPEADGIEVDCSDCGITFELKKEN